MKVALYGRVSTKDQDIKVQQDDLWAWTLRHGHEVVKEYWDEGVSGTLWDRPALSRLMKDAISHRFEAVVVWKLDRFGRSMVNLLTSIQQLKDLEIEFISITNNINTGSNEGKLMLGLLSAFAEYERNLIDERRTAGLAYAKEHGTKSGKPMHRPRKEIDMRRLKELREKGLAIRGMAQLLGVSRTVIRDRLKELDSSNLKS